MTTPFDILTSDEVSKTLSELEEESIKDADTYLKWIVGQTEKREIPKEKYSEVLKIYAHYCKTRSEIWKSTASNIDSINALFDASNEAHAKITKVIGEEHTNSLLGTREQAQQLQREALAGHCC